MQRWVLEDENSIRWDVQNDVHEDSLEMSGRNVSAIITYAVRAKLVLSNVRVKRFISFADELRTVDDLNLRLSVATLHG